MEEKDERVEEPREYQNEELEVVNALMRGCLRVMEIIYTQLLTIKFHRAHLSKSRIEEDALI